MKKRVLNILGQKYKVKTLPGLVENGIAGMCCRKSKEITIDSGLKSKDLLITMIHEIGHAVFHEASIDQAVGPDIEEVIVDNIAKAVVNNLLVKIGA